MSRIQIMDMNKICEEADYLLDTGDTTPPCFRCLKHYEDTLYRKK